MFNTYQPGKCDICGIKTRERRYGAGGPSGNGTDSCLICYSCMTTPSWEKTLWTHFNRGNLPPENAIVLGHERIQSLMREIEELRHRINEYCKMENH
jgi:hypothetical protein